MLITKMLCGAFKCSKRVGALVVSLPNAFNTLKRTVTSIIILLRNISTGAHDNTKHTSACIINKCHIPLYGASL